MQEVGPDKGHMYNCHVILSNEGEIKAAYRKVHLFDVDVPNGPILMESRSTAPGKEVHHQYLLLARLARYLTFATITYDWADKAFCTLQQETIDSAR